MQGLREGQTQVDQPSQGEKAYWCHPVDIHFATRGLQGWPKIHFQVYNHDSFGRNQLIAYGFCHVPTSPGLHTIDVVTWRPSGSLRETISNYYVGGGHQLRHPDWLSLVSDRFRLTTTAMGKVHLQLGIVHRNFDKFGIEC